MPRIRRYLTRPTVALMDVGWWRVVEGLPSGRDDREASWAAVTLSFPRGRPWQRLKSLQIRPPPLRVATGRCAHPTQGCIGRSFAGAAHRA